MAQNKARKDRLEAINSFLKENPNDPFLRFALAQEHRKLGDLEQAVQTFEKLILSHPDYVGAYYHIGEVLAHLGRSQKAEEFLLMGAKVADSAGDSHAYSEIANLLTRITGLDHET